MPITPAFKKLYKSVEKQYLYKDVPSKFKSKYGKKYDKKEVKSVAIAIAKSRNIKIDKGGVKK
jgi:hypothetical protein